MRRRAMSKTKRDGRDKRTKQRSYNRRAVIAIGLTFSLLVVGGVLAQRAGLLSSGHNSDKTKGKEIAPQSFSANSPSKEYIYAGSRQIATEEPTSGISVPALTALNPAHGQQ